MEGLFMFERASTEAGAERAQQPLCRRGLSPLSSSPDHPCKVPSAGHIVDIAWVLLLSLRSSLPTTKLTRTHTCRHTRRHAHTHAQTNNYGASWELSHTQEQETTPLGSSCTEAALPPSKLGGAGTRGRTLEQLLFPPASGESGHRGEPQGTHCLCTSPFENEGMGLDVPKCLPALGRLLGAREPKTVTQGQLGRSDKARWGGEEDLSSSQVPSPGAARRLGGGGAGPGKGGREGGGGRRKKGGRKASLQALSRVASYHLSFSKLLSELWGPPPQELTNSGNSRLHWASVCPTAGKSWESKSLTVFLPLWTPFPQRSWAALQGTPFWLQAWYTSPSPSSGLVKSCPSCSPPPFLRLLEEEALPGKNNPQAPCGWRERQREQGAPSPAGHSTGLCSRKSKSKKGCQGSLRPPAPFLPSSPPPNHSR